MDIKDVFLFGIGNYADPIIELCLDCNYRIKGLYHYNSDRNGKIVNGYKIIGDYNDFYRDHKRANVVVAIGENKIRCEKLKELKSHGHNLISLIHPTAHISKSAVLGEGVYIHINSIVWSKSEIGDCTIISPNVLIGHHCKIGKACLISGSSTIGCYVTIKDKTLVGIGSTIISKEISIGQNVIIGGQSFVTRDIPDNEVWAGVPARKLR